MIPSRSPAPTVKLTSRTAVRPPNRLVTPSSVSMRLSYPQARRQPHQALRDEADDQDEGDAIDDQVDSGEAGLHARKGGPQVRLQGGDEQRSQEWAEGGAHAPDDRVEGEPDRQVDREDVEGVHEADVLGPQGPSDRREGGTHRDRDYL